MCTIPNVISIQNSFPKAKFRTMISLEFKFHCNLIMMMMVLIEWKIDLFGECFFSSNSIEKSVEYLLSAFVEKR